MGNETVAYCCCSASGCGQPANNCLLKVHVKDGAIAAIEPCDPINQGMFREELSEEAIKAEMFQARPCLRGYTWGRTVHHPDRVEYPMKRIGERGERRFERISWDEALDAIADKIKEIAKKYGPHCILGELQWLQWVGPWGFRTWGMSSNSGFILPDVFTLGYTKSGASEKPVPNTEYLNMFNSRLILLFGANPATTESGAVYWHMLAKERGIPIILVDPSYNLSAEVYADQWIPIRPGTDLVMLLAMANVLFKENLYDADYVARFVEPVGFRKWQDYVLGATEGPDGRVDRTPEWAEKICGVPAETIRELARLYARSKPCHFRLHRSATRQLYGENGGRAAIYLQAMTGNIGVSGGGSGNDINFTESRSFPIPSIDWKNAKPKFPAKRLLSKRLWMDAILLRERLKKGEMSEDEYRRRCGIAPDWPLPDIRMIWLQSQNDLVNFRGNYRSGRPSLGNQDLNKFIEAIKKLDFIVTAAYFKTDFHTFFADIVLPLADPMFEEARRFVRSGGTSNHFMCAFKAVDPPGEARPLEWIALQLTRRFGVAEDYNPRLADVVDDYPRGWDRRMDDLLKEGYEKWAERDDIAPRKPPGWEEFKKLPLYRVPFDGPSHVAFSENIERGKPFDTPSGKIEFYSEFLEHPEMARKTYVFPQSGLKDEVCYGGSVPATIPPMAKWVLPWNSMLAEKADRYPLMMITPHSLHRQHTSQDNNPWHRDETRHALHISVVDAKQRGLKDGDLVHIYNDTGEVIMPAYVTSRITPGVVIIRHGAWPELSQTKTALMPEGIDRRGSSNFLTSSIYYPWVVGAVRCADLVQAEKYEGGV